MKIWKRGFWITCICLFIVFLGMVSCCENPRQLLGERVMAGRSFWLTAKIIDQFDTPYVNADLVVRYTYLPLFGGPLKAYLRTETTEKNGILDLSPRGGFTVIQPTDESLAPINLLPWSVPTRSMVRTKDPYGHFCKQRNNGYPESPRILPVWRKVGPQRLQEIAWEETIEGMGPMVYAFDPFAGKQIPLEEIQSTSHAIIIREFHSVEMPDPDKKLSNLEIDTLCKASKYIFYPKGVSWYCVDLEQLQSNIGPRSCLMGVFSNYLHRFPLHQKKSPSDVKMIMTVTSCSSSQSALIDLSVNRVSRWNHNLKKETMRTAMIFSSIINPFGTSFESYDRTDHYYNYRSPSIKHGYTWKQCTNRQEYLAIDPSYPALEKRKFVRSTPVFDPKIPVPQEYDRIPERVVDCQWDTFPFFRGGDPIVPPPITQPNYNPNISEE